LNNVRFLAYARKRCHYPAIDLPVRIPDFSGRLDDSVNFSALLARAGDQVILV